MARSNIIYFIGIVGILFCALIILIVAETLLTNVPLRKANQVFPNKNIGSPHLTYRCSCEPNVQSDCSEKFDFKMGRFDIFICNPKSYRSNVTVLTGSKKIFYNHQEIERIYSLLDQCFGRSAPCTSLHQTSFNVQTNNNSTDCTYYTQIKNQFILCFSRATFISHGYIKGVKLSRAEVREFYEIIRSWAIKDWEDINSINHWSKPQYE